jgi:membrane-associated phospholipid phosphatase
MFLSHMDKKINWGRVAIGAGVTVALVMLGIFWFDKPVYNFLRIFDCGFFKVLGQIFKVTVWLTVSFLAVCVFYIRKVIVSKSQISLRNVYDKVKGSYAFWIFCAVSLATVVCGVLKFILGRARPIFYEALNMTGFFPFAHDWAFHSMPSGHTVASFAGLVMIGLLLPRAKWFTWGLAVLIGVGRVCVGAHWPSDVILGAFIGMLAADIVMSIFARRVKK